MKNNSCMIKGGTNMNRQDFYDGKLFDAYRYMGAHKDGDKIRFVTYAPRASRISIIGELMTGMKNLWNKTHKVVSFYSTPTKLKRVRCTNIASTDQMAIGRNIAILTDLRWN